MKTIVVALALVALAATGPVPDAPVALADAPVARAAAGPVPDTPVVRTAVGPVPNAPVLRAAAPVARTAAGPVPDAPVARAAIGPVPNALVVPETVYKILRSEFAPKEDGSYSFDFETENKIQRQETGELKELLDEDNKPHNVVVVRGSYSYINDLGEQEIMEYWADQTGFHAEGPSVPRNAESASRR